MQGFVQNHLPVLFLVLERITNGDTVTGDTRSAELNIVFYEIKIGFRAHEYVVGHVKPKSCANMRQKVIAAGVIGAACKRALKELLIKPQTFGADSAR